MPPSSALPQTRQALPADAGIGQAPALSLLPATSSAAATAPGPVAAWPPAVLPYRDGMPIPPGYRLDSRINGGLFYGGLAIWAAPYVTGLIAAAASGFTKKSGWLALPIAGPFVAMGGRNIDCSVTGSANPGTGIDLTVTEEKCRQSAIKEARVVALLTVDGLLQTTGAIMAVAGLLSPSEYLLRNDIFPPDTKLSFDAGYSHGQLRLQARMQF